ncbi:MAG: hypothetical protein GPJ54_02430 [Candidatus Heimdallarchaeota archaeon]|nr:hypothetical protein [Candidatus Heimdallarchaeota archaeon]
MAHPVSDMDISKSSDDESHKDITLNIREEILSREFMKTALKSLMKNNPQYEKDMVFNNPLDNMMIMTIKAGDKKITVSGKGRGNLTLDISGDSALVQEFVKALSTEALTLVASELSLCLQKTTPSLTHDNLETSFRKHLRNAISSSINECKVDYK